MLDGNYCQAAPSLEPFPGAFSRLFQNTPAIRFSHSAPPRFGHPSDIAALFEGSKEARVSYLKGLVSGSVALFALFLAWTAVLVFFRIRGPTKYGWLSGSRNPLPPKDAGIDSSNSDNNMKTADGKEETTGELEMARENSIPEATSNEDAAEVEKDGDAYEFKDGDGQEETTDEVEMARENSIPEATSNEDAAEAEKDGDASDNNNNNNTKTAGGKAETTDEVEMAKENSIPDTTSNEDTGEAEKDGDAYKFKDGDGQEVEGGATQQSDDWDIIYEKRKKQDRRMKWLVFAAALGIIICCIMMVSEGVPGLNTVISDLQGTLAIANDILEEAKQFTGGLVNRTQDTGVGVATFVKDFNGICPKVQNQLCENLDNFETCKLEDIFGQDFVFKDIVELFARNNTRVLNQAERAQDFIVSTQEWVEQNVESLKNVDWLFSLSAFFSMLLACLCGCVLVALFVDLPPRVRLWSYRFFLAVFVFLVTFSFVFAIAFVITATATADVCVDSPTFKLQNLLQEKLDSLGPFKAEIARYFIEQCKKPPSFVLQNLLVDGSNFFLDLESFFASNSTTLTRYEEVCGEIDAEKWANAAGAIGTRLCKVSDAVADLLDLFQCRTWYPLYDALVVNTVCYNVDAFSWIAFTQFFVVCLSFIVITCRVTIYQGIEIEDTATITKTDSSPPAVEVVEKDGGVMIISGCDDAEFVAQEKEDQHQEGPSGDEEAATNIDTDLEVVSTQEGPVGGEETATNTGTDLEVVEV